ncbi:hypothetical protein ACFLUS_02080 [Chloroflexota bacterium]
MFDFNDMITSLEPAESKATREQHGPMIYIRRFTDDVIEIIDKAFAMVSEGPLKLITEEADIEEWESYGLGRWCRWCANQPSD